MEYQRYTSGPRRDRSYRRRRLRRRRLTALVVAVLVVAAVAAAVVLVARGGDDRGAAAAAPEGAAGSPATSAASVPATPTPKPTVPPPEVWEASASRPVRVWVGGDSMGGELGWGLGPMLEKTGVLEPVLFYKESSGICRPDFYDWRDKMESVMRNDKPDAVVVMIGANDIQSVWQDGKWIEHGDPDWMRLYQKRVGDMAKTAIKGGARRVYWVGMPIMQKSSSNSYMRSVNKAVQKAVAGIPGAQYVDSWGLFTDEDGDFVQSLRLADGFHFSVEGQKLISKAVLKAIKKDWLPHGVPAPEPEKSPSPEASSI